MNVITVDKDSKQYSILKEEIKREILKELSQPIDLFVPVWKKAKQIIRGTLQLDGPEYHRLETAVSAIIRMKYGVRAVAELDHYSSEDILNEVKLIISVLDKRNKGR